MAQSRASALPSSTLLNPSQKMSGVNPQLCLTSLPGIDLRESGGLGGEQDIRQLICALPIKDIQVLMENLLGPMKEEIGEVRTRMEAMEQKCHICEISQDKVKYTDRGARGEI